MKRFKKYIYKIYSVIYWMLTTISFFQLQLRLLVQYIKSVRNGTYFSISVSADSPSLIYALLIFYGPVCSGRYYIRLRYYTLSNTLYNSWQLCAGGGRLTIDLPRTMCPSLSASLTQWTEQILSNRAEYWMDPWEMRPTCFSDLKMCFTFLFFPAFHLFPAGF